MSDHALVVLAPEDTPEGRGRILHAFVTAKDLAEADENVEIYFDGIGVTVLTAFLNRSNPFTQNYASLFDSIRPLIAGVCDFCARKRFDAVAASETFEIPFVGGEDRHHSLASLLTSGYTINTF